MTTNNKYTILADIATWLEKYSSTFPKPDDTIGKPEHPKIITLWLAMDHGLRTIRSMSRILKNDENDVVLACILLRPFFELSVRLLWASCETDGWIRLFASYTNESKKWADGLKKISVPGIDKKAIDKIADNELQECQEFANCKDSRGIPIKKAPDFRKFLDDLDIENNPLRVHGNWGRVHYVLLYQMLCHASHTHIKTLTRELDRIYLSFISIGAFTAAGNLLLAFMHQTSKSPKINIQNIYPSLLQWLNKL